MWETRPGTTDRVRTAFRWIAAVAFVLAGANHFYKPAFYHKIIPPGFPAPGMLVIVSGIGEIAGGLGLLVPLLRRAAGWGLILLLVAVFPANLYMAFSPESIPDLHFPQWALWARLPLQAVLIAWVWWVSQRDAERAPSGLRRTPTGV